MRRKVEIRCTGLGSFRQLGSQLLSSLQIFSKYLLGTHDVPYLAKALEILEEAERVHGPQRLRKSPAVLNPES